MTRALRAVAPGALALLGGCADAPLEWRYRAPEAVQGGTALFEGRIRAGGCDGEELAAYRFAPGEDPGARPPALGEGTYGFEIEARDATCRPIGRGCATLGLPADAELVFVPVRSLEPAEAPRCAPDRCDAGRCGE